MAQWYAVYTRPRWEKKVMETLQKRRIEHYCPMTRLSNSWNAADRRKTVYQPVFASYIFVKATDDLLRMIKKIDGVINIVYWRDKPAIIREIEIEMMRRFLQEHESVNLEKTSVSTSEIVKIINSTVSGGDDLELPVQKVKLVLPSLGFMMEAVVEAEMEIRLQPDTRALSTSLAKFG
jgi:transcription antitermination factor NusG